MMLGRLTKDMPVVFEKVKFLRATTIPKDNSMELYVMVQRASGNFEVIEGGATVVTGHVRVPEDVSKEITPLPLPPPNETYAPLTEKDVYKELKLRGYNYRYGGRWFWHRVTYGLQWGLSSGERVRQQCGKGRCGMG